MSSPYKSVTPTPEQKEALEVARVGLMAACPFYAHLFYRLMEGEEVITMDLPTAATDGKRLYINPAYLASLKPPERVFLYAHEMDHFVSRHPQRMKHYVSEGFCNGKPMDPEQFNIAADYCINAALMEQGVGLFNPDWLYDPLTTGDDVVEEVYARIYKKPDQTKGGGGSGGGGGQGKTYGQSGKSPRGAKGDPTAAANGGRFDTILEPQTDPVTGRVDEIGEAEFKQAIAAAASAAKAMGDLPGRLQRMVDEILAPQVDWREHVRLLMTGHIGARHETWIRPNRRRLVLNPVIVLPGRRGYGAEDVCVVIDNSGSVDDIQLTTFFSEVGGILADVRPKRVILIWCDSKIRQVDEAGSLDELAEIRVKGAPGGGGTNFIPPFEYLAENDIVPETLVYITDAEGRFPAEKPAYPVIWCVNTECAVPWGEVVRIKNVVA